MWNVKQSCSTNASTFVHLLITDQPGSIVVCVNPLNAILKDQAAIFSALGLAAEFIGEGQTDPTVKLRVLRENVQLLFISPENTCFKQRSTRSHLFVLLLMRHTVSRPGKHT